MNPLSYQQPDSSADGYRPWLHRVALLTAAATFPLIFMGGLVTSHGAGMSVPDWPNSYGYNMFTFPPSKWVGGIFYEHTHRLMGTVVGLTSTVLFLMTWGFGQHATVRKRLQIGALVCFVAAVGCAVVPATLSRIIGMVLAYGGLALIGACLCRVPEQRPWVRWLAMGVLGAVIFQGILGGLRVVMVELDIAIVHACFAQAFFCLAAATAVVTSQWWLKYPLTPALSPEYRGEGVKLFALGAIAVVSIYLQLIVGAMMRHYEAGLAVPDLPLAYGQLIPATDDVALKAINDDRAWNLHLDAVTAGQIWLHMGHRIGAIIVTGAIVTLLIYVFRKHRHDAKLAWPACIIALLLIAQITLGVLTVLWRKPADIASAHVAVGALLLMTTFVLTLRAARQYSLAWRRAGNAASENRLIGFPEAVTA